MSAKLAWAVTLKVGDLVCDCRYQHRRIEKIEDVREPKNDALAIGTWLLASISPTLAVLMQNGIFGLGGGMVVDRIVYFADGTRCHATRCLDPTTNCLHS